MIALVTGNFIHKTPANVIVDVQGVGYELHISLHTYSAIRNMQQGTLLTYLQVKEDAHVLYGFFEATEKELFIKLISISGVGASTARMMLSGLKPDEIIKAIAQQNSSTLERIKGIGKKTAERIVLELKDKLHKDLTTITSTLGEKHTIQTDAFIALTALGVSKPIAEQALQKALQQHPSPTSVEVLIKLALKML